MFIHDPASYLVNVSWGGEKHYIEPDLGYKIITTYLRTFVNRQGQCTHNKEAVESKNESPDNDGHFEAGKSKVVVELLIVHVAMVVHSRSSNLDAPITLREL